MMTYKNTNLRIKILLLNEYERNPLVNVSAYY